MGIGQIVWAGVQFGVRILTAKSDLSKAVFFSKARPASFLVLDVNTTSLKAVSVLQGFKTLDF